MTVHTSKLCRLTAAAVFIFTAGVLRAGELVPGLDDGAVLADYTAAHAGVDGADTTDITSGQVTLAARFNPDASQASGGPVIVIEVGGTTNGTGLYIGDGQLLLAAKYATTTGIATSMNDTDFSDGVLAVTLGEITFGAENTVYASLNVKTGELIYSINGTGGFAAITGATGNEDLDGNHSVSFLGSGAIVTGHMGGLTDSSAGSSLLFKDNAVNMVQTAGYSNQRGQVFEATALKEISPYSIVVQSTGTSDVSEGGGSVEITISITDYPGSYPVSISLSESLSPAQLVIEPSIVVFKSSNWSSAQSVSIAAADDKLKEAREHFATIEFDVMVDSASGYYGIILDDSVVSIQENDCEVWGYDSFDINQDCQLDLADLSHIIAQWLECTLPVSGCADYRP